ncbi:tautomerase family protein [Mesorhizobium sp. PL10]
MARLSVHPSRSFKRGRPRRVDDPTGITTKEYDMPVIHIETFKADDDKKEDLAAEITKLFCDKMNLRPEQIHVVFDEYEPSNWATGGKLWSRM